MTGTAKAKYRLSKQRRKDLPIRSEIPVRNYELQIEEKPWKLIHQPDLIPQEPVDLDALNNRVYLSHDIGYIDIRRHPHPRKPALLLLAITFMLSRLPRLADLHNLEVPPCYRRFANFLTAERHF